MPTNVLGTELRSCCKVPVTGFYRDGYCRTGPCDVGLHTVCARMTKEFLEFSALGGNDLMTPQPHFPGLVPGDVIAWREILETGPDDRPQVRDRTGGRFAKDRFEFGEELLDRIEVRTVRRGREGSLRAPG